MFYIFKKAEAGDGNDITVWVPSLIRWEVEEGAAVVSFQGYTDLEAYRNGLTIMDSVEVHYDVHDMLSIKTFMDKLHDATIVDKESFLYKADKVSVRGVKGVWYRKDVHLDTGSDAKLWRRRSVHVNIGRDKLIGNYEPYTNEDAVISGRSPLPTTRPTMIRTRAYVESPGARKFMKQLLTKLVRTKGIPLSYGKVREL